MDSDCLLQRWGSEDTSEYGLETSWRRKRTDTRAVQCSTHEHRSWCNVCQRRCKHVLTVGATFWSPAEMWASLQSVHGTCTPYMSRIIRSKLLPMVSCVQKLWSWFWVREYVSAEVLFTVCCCWYRRQKVSCVAHSRPCSQNSTKVIYSKLSVHFQTTNSHLVSDCVLMQGRPAWHKCQVVHLPSDKKES